MKRVMWIEHKLDGLSGPARIGWVEVKKRGKQLLYRDQVFNSLYGFGFKANYFDTATGEHYWISGCRKDGRDALYNTEVKVDTDAREEYWCSIRRKPASKHIRRFRSKGKYGR
jgi:hypothetical protein